MSEAPRTPEPGDEYLPKIVAIAAEQFRRDDAGIDGDTTLGGLGADDLARSEMLCAIEHAFKVLIPADAERALTDDSTLQHLARLVAQAKGEIA